MGWVLSHSFLGFFIVLLSCDYTMIAAVCVCVYYLFSLSLVLLTKSYSCIVVVCHVKL